MPWLPIPCGLIWRMCYWPEFDQKLLTLTEIYDSWNKPGLGPHLCCFFRSTFNQVLELSLDNFGSMVLLISIFTVGIESYGGDIDYDDGVEIKWRRRWWRWWWRCFPVTQEASVEWRQRPIGSLARWSYISICLVSFVFVLKIYCICPTDVLYLLHY